MADYVYFPEELITLQQEALQHPPLVLLFQSIGPCDLGESLAHIAHYLGIPVDDVMDEADVKRFADYLTRKLYEERTSIVLTLQ